jgi:hypothetical protein
VLATLGNAALYFACVFGAGFVLGALRVTWLVPLVGDRFAELMEMPVMLAVIVAAARWVVRRFAVPATPARRLGMGGVALGLMLVFEFTLVLWLRGMSIGDYLAGRDPVSGTAYYLLLGVFAAMPLLVRPR